MQWCLYDLDLNHWFMRQPASGRDMKQVWRARKRRNSPPGTLASGVLSKLFDCFISRHTHSWSMNQLFYNILTENVSWLKFYHYHYYHYYYYYYYYCCYSALTVYTDYIFLPRSYVCKCLVLKLRDSLQKSLKTTFKKPLRKWKMILFERTSLQKMISLHTP